MTHENQSFPCSTAVLANRRQIVFGGSVMSLTGESGDG